DGLLHRGGTLLGPRLHGALQEPVASAPPTEVTASRTQPRDCPGVAGWQPAPALARTGDGVPTAYRPTCREAEGHRTGGGAEAQAAEHSAPACRRASVETIRQERPGLRRSAPTTGDGQRACRSVPGTRFGRWNTHFLAGFTIAEGFLGLSRLCQHGSGASARRGR